MNTNIIDALKCPVCGNNVYVSENGKSLFCTGARRHCFDFSSDGYVSLSRQGSGDLKDAVNARRAFLSMGHYLPLAERLCEITQRYAPNGIALDAGCGEGYYTNKLAETSLCTMGFDLSKFGVACASKLAKRQGIDNVLYATASVFELPVKDESCDCVVNIFAPCCEDEYMRVLRTGGALVVVGAGKDHLMGLKEALYDTTYENTERVDLPKMAHAEHVNLSYDIEVEGRENIEALFSMTPYYWRTSMSDKEKLSRLDILKTKVEFEIYVYKKD